jgi:hypothetical protein
MMDGWMDGWMDEKRYLVVLECLRVTLHGLLIVLVRSMVETIDVPAFENREGGEGKGL